MAECTCANPQLVANKIGEVKGEISTQNGENRNTYTKQTNALHETIYGKGLKSYPPTAGGTAVDASGKPGAIGPLRNCHWAAPEYGPVGEGAWSAVFKAAALAIALANSVAQAEIADMQQDLAEGYYDQAKFKWDRFNDKYIPLEKKLLAEVSSTPIREMNCAAAEDRAIDAVNTSYSVFEAYLERMAKQYNLCMDASLLATVDVQQTMQLVDSENYNLVDEQWYTDYKNDQRWNRRSNVLNLGRNLSFEALKYGDVANSLLKSVGQKIETAAQGVMGALGYYGSRFDTVYPTTYLAGAGQNTNGLVSLSSSPKSSLNLMAEDIASSGMI